MDKTNIGLVEYAKAHLGAPYWNGTFGQIATQAILDYNTARLPDMYTPERRAKYISQFGKQVFDCIGLIKGYLWSDSITGVPKYASNGVPDVNAGGMRSLCIESGAMSSMPEIAGILVFVADHHVGIYIGGGQVVEARGFADGVIQTNVKNGSWDGWGKCPFITYINNNEVNTMTDYTVVKQTKLHTRQDVNSSYVLMEAGSVIGISELSSNNLWGKTTYGAATGWTDMDTQYLQKVVTSAPIPSIETVPKSQYDAVVLQLQVANAKIEKIKQDLS